MEREWGYVIEWREKLEPAETKERRRHGKQHEESKTKAIGRLLWTGTAGLAPVGDSFGSGRLWRDSAQGWW